MPIPAFETKNTKKFGRRKDARRIIFAKGNEVTSVTVHPFLALGGFATAILFAATYIGATGYLMFRDDILKTSHIRQVRIQNAYEDQLANLRIEIDRIASRQMLDQASVENKLDRLLGLRASIDKRQSHVSRIRQTANAAGIKLPSLFTPTPRPHPLRVQSASLALPYQKSSITQKARSHFTKTAAPRSDAFQALTSNKVSDYIRTTSHDVVDLNHIEKSLQAIEKSQSEQIHLILRKTESQSKTLASVIKSLGFNTPSAPKNTSDAIGGPFEDIAAYDTLTFNTHIIALEENLKHLGNLKKKVKQLPLYRPLKTGRISSNFGRRLDPFFKRYAMHSGIDFKAPSGTPVYASGNGKVIKAGWNGGYGRMIEIQHTGGITTRYAHLSRLSVQEGDYILAGSLIGRVGSTGRSTGPHLHYETRLADKPLNPGRFIKAGIKVRPFF